MEEVKEPKMSDLLNQLSDFLREGKEDDAKRLLVRSAPLLTARDDSKRGTEHYCAVGGCLNILKYAISTDPEAANAPDELGWTPLMIASSAGRARVVDYLLSLSQVNVNSKNNNGQTSLHYAASKNHAEIVHLLLTNGADVNAADRRGATPLHRAASQGHEKIVNMLLGQDKIRVDMRDSEGNTPLFMACEENREDIAIALVSKGASLSAENLEQKTPLDVVKTATLRIKLKKAEERFNEKEN